jgi:hypothetical protein
MGNDESRPAAGSDAGSGGAAAKATQALATGEAGAALALGGADARTGEAQQDADKHAAQVSALEAWMRSNISLAEAVAAVDAGEGKAVLLDEGLYRRILVARAWSDEAARVMLEAHVRWRATTLPSTVRRDKLPPGVFESGVFTVIGTTREGMPVILSHHRRFEPDNFTDENYAVYLIYIMEEAIRAMPPGVEQIVLVFDMDGFEFGKHAGPSVIRKGQAMIAIAQDHYPERLRRMISFNAPRLFHGIWKLATPFIDAKTQDKIIFTRTLDELCKYVDSSLLPPRLVRPDETKHV